MAEKPGNVNSATADPETGLLTHSDAGESFELQPSPPPGEISEHVIDELRRCYREAKDYTGALRDAVKAQAEKAKIKPAALRRYIAALEGDTIDEAAKEAEDLERLIEAHGAA
jgi:hypothetical protein